MTIEFHCPHCDKLLKTADDKAGVRANCPGCGKPVVVPTASESSARSDPSFPPQASGPPSAGPPLLPAAAPQAESGIGGPMKSCPMCGEQVKAAATRCRYCGEELTNDLSRRNHLAPHRGTLILTLGIIGLVILVICTPLGVVGLPLGIAAWVMGNNDLREIAAGRMDRAGEGQTQAGRILGIIACCLALLMVLVFVIVFVFAILENAHR